MLSYKENEVLLIQLQASFGISVGATTLNIMTLSIMTLSIMTFITMELSILGLFVTPSLNDTA
jgi:hypothetical protein